MRRNGKVTLCHLPTFVIAATASGKNFTSLTVHRLDEIFRSRDYDNDNPALHLRSLKVDLSQVWYRYDKMDDPAQLAPWVRDLPNLEELSIYQNPGNMHGEADVIQLFTHISLPKLEKVKVRHVNVFPGVLQNFLMHHDSTLGSIEIFEPYMDEEEWKELRQLYSPLAEGKGIQFADHS